MGKSGRSRWRPAIGFVLAATLVATLATTLATAMAGSAVGAPPPRPSGELRLYVLDCGVLLYNSPLRFGYKPGEVSPSNLANSCYLIDDPGKGTLLWDTGVVPDSAWTPGGWPPKKEYAEATAPLKDQLAAIGYRPEDVTYVAVSHMHWDHVANLYQFARSTWLASPYTRDHLLSDEKGDKIEPSMFTPLRTAKIVVTPDDHDYDVFGDGKVIRVPTPGHTPDHGVLVVKLKNHKPVILSGDLYHFRRDVALNTMMRGDDAPVLTRTREKVAALARQLGAEIWVGHDWNDFAAQKKAPAYYD